MPELPEVETSRRGIEPHLVNRVVTDFIVRQPKLRWRVPDVKQLLCGQKINAVERRAKYLLIRFDNGTLIIHLGMSGSLRILPADTPAGFHDHVDLVCGDSCLRLRDPRRFGSVLWTDQDPQQHIRIIDLGPEPLSDSYNAEYFHAICKQRKAPIKSVLMDGKVVVGIGNIYATESLFRAGIHPARKACNVSLKRIETLVAHSKTILAAAIEQGGTTLRDFQQQDGKPGYFVQKLAVYGKSGEKCPNCDAILRNLKIGQRASCYCPQCQR